jgi:hypothetical protein
MPYRLSDESYWQQSGIGSRLSYAPQSKPATFPTTGCRTQRRWLVLVEPEHGIEDDDLPRMPRTAAHSPKRVALEAAGPDAE